MSTARYSTCPETIQNLTPYRKTDTEFSVRDDSDHEIVELRNLMKLNEETYQHKLKILEDDNKQLKEILMKEKNDNEEAANKYKQEIQKLEKDLSKNLT